MKIWLVKFIVKIWRGASNQHMQVSKGKSRHACMRCTPSVSIISLFRDCNKWLHTKQNMSTPTYEVAHLKCVKRLISSAVLWCVASTRTRPRNLITTMPSPSRTELWCLNCTCLWLHDRRANHLLGPPVIDAKAGAVSRSFRYTLSLPHEADGHAALDSIL